MEIFDNIAKSIGDKVKETVETNLEQYVGEETATNIANSAEQFVEGQVSQHMGLSIDNNQSDNIESDQ
ncbi:MAG: hypothetical protein NVS2B14_06120 [Chamaesiphon sp.]